MLLENVSRITFPLAEISLKRAIREKFSILKREMSQPYAVRKARQLQQIHAQLKLAQTKVPYYQDLFKKKQFNPDQVLKDIRYFHDLPYLDKDTVRSDLKRFISSDYDFRKLEMRETNGSTGPTIPIYYNTEALDWSSAVNLYTSFVLGKAPHKRETYISPDDMIEGKFSDKIMEALKCTALNRQNLRYKHLGEDDLDRLCRDLKKSNPQMVLATPSTFNALAKYIKRNPRRSMALNTLISTGEILDHCKKEEIEKYLKCRVYNRLGNAEVGIYAHDTLTRELEIIDYIAYVETLENPGNSEIVITNLKNSVMPLLRYRTGDLGEKSVSLEGECLKNIHGRVHEVLYVNGESIHTNLIKEMLFKIGNVEDFQIHKCAHRGYVIKIVADEKYRPLIQNQIYQIWKKTFEVEFTSLDQLAKVGVRRKFQYFIDDTVMQRGLQ